MTKYYLSFTILAMTMAASAVVAQTSVAPVGTGTVSPAAATSGTVAPAPVSLITNAPVSITSSTPAPISVTVTTAPVVSSTVIPTTGITATVLPTAPTTTTVIAPTVAPASTPISGSNNYFDEAMIKWNVTLALGGRLGSGNAVTPSPDGGLIYITRADGRLDVIQASDGSPVSDFTPQPTESGWTVTCSSGVYFGNLFGNEYAAYAVIDTPPTGSGFDFTR